MPAGFLLAYLLIPFGIVLAAVSLFFFFNIFHLRRYAIKSSASTLLMLAYWLCFLGLLVVITGLLSRVDWSKKYTPSELVPEFNLEEKIPLNF